MNYWPQTTHPSLFGCLVPDTEPYERHLIVVSLGVMVICPINSIVPTQSLLPVWRTLEILLFVRPTGGHGRRNMVNTIMLFVRLPGGHGGRYRVNISWCFNSCHSLSQLRHYFFFNRDVSIICVLMIFFLQYSAHNPIMPEWKYGTSFRHMDLILHLLTLLKKWLTSYLSGII